MQLSLAFVLIALFAVVTISQALPQPLEVAAAATADNDGATANTKIVLELTPEEAAAVEAMGGRSFWTAFVKTVHQVIIVGCQIINCKN
uniref:Uncharacterized protein n=1 Tax=Anopheles christyi TaxID=43041 RepID=A0A182KGL5_9DIPT